MVIAVFSLSQFREFYKKCNKTFSVGIIIIITMGPHWILCCFQSLSPTCSQIFFFFFEKFRRLHLIWGFTCLCHFKTENHLCSTTLSSKWERNNIRMTRGWAKWNHIIGIHIRGRELFFVVIFAIRNGNDGKRHFWNNKYSQKRAEKKKLHNLKLITCN